MIQKRQDEVQLLAGLFLKNLYMGLRTILDFFTLKLKLQVFLAGHIVVMGTYRVMITCYL